MSFYNLRVVNSVICSYEAHGLSENRLCLCMQVWGCTGTEKNVCQVTRTKNMVHQGWGSRILQTDISAASGHFCLSSKMTMLRSRWSSKVGARPCNVSFECTAWMWIGCLPNELVFWNPNQMRTHAKRNCWPSNQGSFTREMWSQQTQLFNLLRPHMRTKCQLSDSFWFVRKSDKISKRQAEFVTDNATAKQRRVRNLCATESHTVSSSWSYISTRWNTCGIDPEQDANSVDSTKHVQKTELSGKYVHEIQTICESLQAQVSNIKFRDQEINWFSEEVDWTHGLWRNLPLCMTEFPINSVHKCTYSVMRFRVLADFFASKISFKVRNIDHIAT